MPREIRKSEPITREDELFEIRKDILERQDWQGNGNEDFYDEENEYEEDDEEYIGVRDDDDDEYVDEDDEYEDEDEGDDGM